MRKLLVIAVLIVSSVCVKAQSPWTKGAFETRQYRNVFVEMGYKPEQVEAKLKEVFYDVFEGPNKVYFEV